MEGSSWRAKIRVAVDVGWGESFVSAGLSGHANISAVLPESPAVIEKQNLVNSFNCLCDSSYRRLYFTEVSVTSES